MTSSDAGYEVVVPEPVARQLEALPHRIAEDALEHLERLGRDPSLGIRVHGRADQHGPMVFAFSVLRAPVVFRVAVSFRFVPGEKKLVLTRASLVEDDDPDLGSADAEDPPDGGAPGTGPAPERPDPDEGSDDPADYWKK